MLSARRFVLASLITGLALTAIACGSRPESDRLERARMLVAEAETMSAELYAPAALAQAREALAAAEAEYADQDGFSLRRSPDLGNELADQAAALADEAINAATSELRARAKEAREELTRAETAVVTVEAALATLARCGRQNRVTGIREFGARFEALRNHLVVAQRHFDEGDYQSTTEVGRRAVNEAGVYVTDVKHAAYGAGCS